jgi:selenocysteine lyase/cysteine desulfurase
VLCAQVPGKTKVLSISHVLTTSGLRLPIKQLSVMAHK